MLYLSMTGAREAMLAQAARSNNLSNASTPGFKADLSQTRSQPMFGPGLPSRVYAMSERPAVDLDPGAIQTTGRDLDIAVRGEGWIAIQAADGTEAYTRAGDLRISPLGLLTTGAGHPVLGNGGPIAVPPAETVEIGADGTITIRPLGQDANTLAEVDRIKLVNPPKDQLEKAADGLIRGRDGAVFEPDATVGIVSGALESSNVNLVGELVGLIENARRFELQIQMMNTARDEDRATTEMLRLT